MNTNICIILKESLKRISLLNLAKKYLSQIVYFIAKMQLLILELKYFMKTKNLR
jgi:hypothetical protein